MEKIHAFIHFHSFHGFRFRQGLFCTGSGGCPAECPSPQLRRKACASSSQARSHGSPSERSARQCSKSSPLANYASSTPTTKCCLSDKLDVIHDFQPAGFPTAFIPSTIPIGAIAPYNNTNLHINESRLSLDLRRDTNLGDVR